jgi:hypothetical protein
MTPAPNESAPNDQPEQSGEEGIAQRCVQYLLAELSSTEAAQLESELKTSPAVNRELLLQAELLCALAASQATPSQLPSLEAAPSLESLPTAGFTAHGRHWVMIIAALAACLVVAIAGSLRQRENDLDAARLEASNRAAVNDEALLIARVWASSHVSMGNVEDWGGAEGEVDLVDDPPANDDSFLDWMVVAVAADVEVELATSGTTSDG